MMYLLMTRANQSACELRRGAGDDEGFKAYRPLDMYLSLIHSNSKGENRKPNFKEQFTGCVVV